MFGVWYDCFGRLSCLKESVLILQHNTENTIGIRTSDFSDRGFIIVFILSFKYLCHIFMSFIRTYHLVCGFKNYLFLLPSAVSPQRDSAIRSP